MNVIISQSKWNPDDIQYVFCYTDYTLDKGEGYRLVGAKDLSSLLVKLGIFKTTSQARHAGRIGEIPIGYNEIKASKKVPRLCIWNPR